MPTAGTRAKPAADITQEVRRIGRRIQWFKDSSGLRLVLPNAAHAYNVTAETRYLHVSTGTGT